MIKKKANKQFSDLDHPEWWKLVYRYLLVESNVHKAHLCTESTTRDKKTHPGFLQILPTSLVLLHGSKVSFWHLNPDPSRIADWIYRFFGPRNLEETQLCPTIFSNGFPILKHIPANQKNTLTFPKSFKIEVYLGWFMVTAMWSFRSPVYWSCIPNRSYLVDVGNCTTQVYEGIILSHKTRIPVNQYIIECQLMLLFH